MGIPPAQPGPSAELDGRVVLCVGSLQPDKDQRALVELARSSGDHIVLVGRDEDAHYAAELRRTAPDNVTFVGEAPDPAPWFRRADVFVLPSRTESCPNALLEAMSYGCPVVATDVGDVREILDDGRLGHVIAVGDAAALAAAAADPIAGDAGPDRVQLRYSMDGFVRGCRELYDRLRR